MKLLKLTSLAFLLLTASFSISAFIKTPYSAPSAGPMNFESPIASQDLLTYMDLLEKRLSECNCPGASVAIVRDSNEIFLRGLGNKSAYGRETVSENTVFRIGSLSKGFAAVLTGILVEKGMLNWDDRVVDHLPWFTLHSPAQASRIRIEHLLSHTTGLPLHSYTNLVEAGKSVRSIANELPKVKLLGEEGKIYAYQNAAYSIIEEVMHQATGKPMEELLGEYIFHPLNMEQSSASYEDISSAEDKATPHRYRSSNKVFTPTSISKKYYNSISSGGINSSAHDMASWLNLLLGNYPELISDQTLSEVFTPYISTTHARKYFNQWDGVKESHYAFGWRVIDFDDRRLISHGGYVNGFRSEIAIDRDRKIGICVLFNGPCDYAKDVVPEFFRHIESHQPVSSTTTSEGE